MLTVIARVVVLVCDMFIPPSVAVTVYSYLSEVESLKQSGLLPKFFTVTIPVIVSISNLSFSLACWLLGAMSNLI